MRRVEPAVVRVLDVPTSVLLPELHDLLQVALGWTDSHLHQFVADRICYGRADTDGPEDERDESDVGLRALPERFVYRYDFGDGWEHDVVVVGAGGDRPCIVGGKGVCPPEDVGGPHGYAEFREVMADPDHPEHDRMQTWAGNWTDRFDLAAADLLVRQTVGAVPAPVRLLLGLAADGVTLTPGGRLPRALVRDVQEHYPSWHRLTDGPASVEEDLSPLAALHDVLRQVGLLRLRKGVLSPTRATADDVEVIRRIRWWFGPTDGFVSILAGDALASLIVDGPARPAELASRLLALLGDRWVTSQGQPLDHARTCSELYRLESVLIGLDLIQSSAGSWAAGPSVQWLLPRATALADLWSKQSTSA